MGKEFSRELFNDLYNKNKKSIRKIASQLNVGKTNVEYYLKKFKIKRRTHEEARKLCLKEYGWAKGLTKETDERVGKLAKSIKEAYIKKRKQNFKKIEFKFGKPIKELINYLYWEKNYSQNEVAKKLGLHRSIVIELMKKFNIPKRPKYQYISSLKGINHSSYGKTWEDIQGKIKAQKRKRDYSLRFRNLTIKRLENNEFPFFDTKIEKIVAKELLKRKIHFIKQFRVGNKFVCDFAIPFAKIIIECDGDYWHANPKIYNKNLLNTIQKNKIKRDRSKDNYLNDRGWVVLRFFESDIHEDINKCINKVQEKLNK